MNKQNMQEFAERFIANYEALSKSDAAAVIKFDCQTDTTSCRDICCEWLSFNGSTGANDANKVDNVDSVLVQTSEVSVSEVPIEPSQTQPQPAIDIVQRLRDAAIFFGSFESGIAIDPLLNEAADEIASLRNNVRSMRESLT